MFFSSSLNVSLLYYAFYYIFFIFVVFLYLLSSFQTLVECHCSLTIMAFHHRDRSTNKEIRLILELVLLNSVIQFLVYRVIFALSANISFSPYKHTNDFFVRSSVSIVSTVIISKSDDTKSFIVSSES